MYKASGTIQTIFEAFRPLAPRLHEIYSSLIHHGYRIWYSELDMTMFCFTENAPA